MKVYFKKLFFFNHRCKHYTVINYKNYYENVYFIVRFPQYLTNSIISYTLI